MLNLRIYQYGDFQKQVQNNCRIYIFRNRKLHFVSIIVKRLYSSIPLS